MKTISTRHSHRTGGTELRTLTLVSTGLGLPERDELVRLEAADLYPRISVYRDALQSDWLNEKFLERAPATRRMMYRLLPISVAQVLEAFFSKREYAALISWAEHLGLPLAFLLKITGVRVPHIAIFSWISKSKKAKILKKVHSHIDRLILMSSAQRDFALNVLHIPEYKVKFLKWPVDEKFWRPMDGESDMISTVGSEMRDYPTLIKAMQGLDISCHIAAGTLRDVMHPTIKAIWDLGPLPDNVAVGKKSYVDLRALYARSRFVVIPLHSSDTDNGTTSILEAMAMGKAVICSQTEGQVDVITEGRNGLYVPPGDPKALQQAIRYLWEHPDEAERMGREGRRFIEENHRLDNFVRCVKGIVREVVEEKYIPDKSILEARTTGTAKCLKRASVQL
jgi:glycosyltransferase involved in cell wall biosynthesis